MLAPHRLSPMADVPIRDVAVMLYDLDDDQVQHLLDDVSEAHRTAPCCL